MNNLTIILFKYYTVYQLSLKCCLLKIIKGTLCKHIRSLLGGITLDNYSDMDIVLGTKDATSFDGNESDQLREG